MMKITNKFFNKNLSFKINWTIMIPVILLCLFSLVLLRSTSSQLFYKQAIWLCIGSGLIIFIQFIRLRIFNEYAYHLYLLLLILLCITYFMPEINKAQRWIVTPFVTFQPSEIGKIFLIFAIAKFLSEKNLLDKGLKFRSMILPDKFIEQDKPESMYKFAGLDSQSIEEKIIDLLNSNIILQKQKQ